MVCSSLGLAVGALAPTGDVALSVGPALMVVYVIMGAIGPAGIGTDKLPKILKPFRLFSPIKWACEALCSAEFKGQPFDVTEYQQGGGLLTGLGMLVGGVFTTVLSLPVALIRSALAVISFNKIILGKNNGHMLETDGDRTLSMLGIPGALFQNGVAAMWQMLGTHLGLALVGLLLSRTSS